MTTYGSPGELILSLQRATHATLDALAVRLADLDLLPSEINALASLAAGPLSVSALAAATATRKTTLTSVLDRLADRGYVVRDPDPRDRRSFQVSLTSAGRSAAAKVVAAMGELERQASAGASDADRAGFQAITHALTEASHEPRT